MEDIYFNKNKFIGPLSITRKCGRGGKGTKTLKTLELPSESGLEIIVECSHGQRSVRWCRRYQLCKKCLSESEEYKNKISNINKNREITWGNKISQAKKGIKSSFEHRKALSIAQSKIDPNSWKDFYEKSEIAKIRDSIEYKEFRKSVMARDNYACALTGRKGHLVVHHLVGVSTDNTKILEIDNGITLHVEVHKDFHKLYGKSHNTAEQFVEFKRTYYGK
jgi:5-methylcytosine-specific restriction endonuclease McrA